jgi:metallo-beta-lactamase family protein
MQRFVSLAYDDRQTIVPGVSLRLLDAGHILGSAIVELELEEHGQHCTVVFSGDLGHSGAVIMHDPIILESADVVILESTYGDRPHRAQNETLDEMAALLSQANTEGGNVLIPAFAVGRTQELLYLFGRYFKQWDLARWRIVLDSPLAIEATEIYLRHSQLFDAQARELFSRERRLSVLPNLSFSRTAAQSMALNRSHSGTIIIAGSGMCTGGRIKHHLKHNVWRRDCHIVMVGFQGRGTLGRQLVDGAKHIRLWGETIRVNAQAHTLGGFSAHADQGELLRWYGHFRHQPPVVLVHGEAQAQQALARKMQENYGVVPRLATRGEKWALPTR